MKWELIIGLMLMMLILGGSLRAQGDYIVYKAKNGKEMNIKALAKELCKYDVVFFGEYHDNADLHAMELELLQELVKCRPDVTVSLEMFERDVQPVLDAYLVGDISENKFLSQSRPWGNYETDYRPLVEYARANRLPVIAANVPREYASLLAKGGLDSLNSLPANDRVYAARTLVVNDDGYKTAFIRTMRENEGHGMPVSPHMYEKLYAAQCLKDDTMAESIQQCHMCYPQRLVIHFNGDFHSKMHLGTAQKLHMLNPKLKIAVISPAYIDSLSPLTWDKSLKEDGDYVVMLHEVVDQQTGEE